MALLLRPDDVVATALSPYSIRLKWTNNDMYEVLEIWRSLDDYDYGTEPYKTIDGGDESYVDSGLDPETLYSYYLVGRTYEPPNYSLTSDPAEATTFATEAAPTDLVAEPLTDTKTEVTWKVNSTMEDSMRVERSPDVMPREWAEVSGSPIAARRDYYQDTGRTKNTKYWYRVCINYVGGPSEYSNEDDATTYNNPTAPSALAITELKDKSLRLTWTLGTGKITGTKIEKSDTGVFGGEEEVFVVGKDITEFLVTGLDPNTQYWFRVRDYGPGGDSAYSNTATDTTLATYAPTEFEKFIRIPVAQLVALSEINPGKELTGFTLVDGKTYTYELAITDRAIVDFEKVFENGKEYAEKSSINEVEANASTFYFDTSTKILYIHTSTGADPSGFCIVGRFWLHFSNKENITYNGNFYLPLLSLENIPSVSQEISPIYTGAFTISTGTISLKNDEKTSKKFFDKRFAGYIWQDAKHILKIGKEGFAYSQFKEVFTSLVDSYNCNDRLFSLNMKDLRANLGGPVPMNKYSSEEFPLMDLDAEGKVIPRVFGHRDVPAVCVDTEYGRWMFHDDRISEVEKLFVKRGEELLEKTKDVDFYVDYQRGRVTFDKSVSIDWEEDIVKVHFTGMVNSALEPVINAADIFKHILNETMGLANSELDHDSIYRTKYVADQNLSLLIYKEESLANIVHKIENSTPATTFQDEKGRIGLQVAQTVLPSNAVHVENFHLSEDGHSQDKTTKFIFKEINIYYKEHMEEGKWKWEVETKSLDKFVWKYGKRRPLEPLDVYTYRVNNVAASALADDIATKLEQLEAGFIKETLPWVLYGCRAGDLIVLSRDRFFSSAGTADEITVRLLKLDKMISSGKSAITGVIVS